MSTKKPTAAESAKIVRAIAENASLRWFHGNEERHWSVGVNELPDGDVDAALHAAAEALELLAEIVNQNLALTGPPSGPTPQIVITRGQWMTLRALVEGR